MCIKPSGLFIYQKRSHVLIDNFLLMKKPVVTQENLSYNVSNHNTLEVF